MNENLLGQDNSFEKAVNPTVLDPPPSNRVDSLLSQLHAPGPEQQIVPTNDDTRVNSLLSHIPSLPPDQPQDVVEDRVTSLLNRTFGSPVPEPPVKPPEIAPVETLGVELPTTTIEPDEGVKRAIQIAEQQGEDPFISKMSDTPSFAPSTKEKQYQAEHPGPITFFEQLGREWTTNKAAHKIPFIGGIAHANELISLKNMLDRLTNYSEDDYARLMETEKRAGEDRGIGFAPEVGGSGVEWSKYNADELLKFGEEKRKADLKEVGEFIKFAAESQERGMTFGAKVAGGLSIMPSWIAEFMMTGGLYKFGDTAVRKAGMKLLSNHIKSQVGKKIGKEVIRIGGWAAGSTVRTAGLFPRIMEEYMIRQTPTSISTEQAKREGYLDKKGMSTADRLPGDLLTSTQKEKIFQMGTSSVYLGKHAKAGKKVYEPGQLMFLDKKGEVRVVGDPERPVASLLKAAGTVWVETATEAAGSGISRGGKGFAKWIGNRTGLTNRLLPKLQRAWTNLPINKHLSKQAASTAFFKKIATRSGYDGLIEEFSEERLATILHGILGTEDFGAGAGAGWLERSVAGIRQDLTLENVGVEGVVLATPGAGHFAMRTIGAYRGKQKMQKAYREHYLTPEIVDVGQGKIIEREQGLPPEAEVTPKAEIEGLIRVVDYDIKQIEDKAKADERKLWPREEAEIITLNAKKQALNKIQKAIELEDMLDKAHRGKDVEPESTTTETYIGESEAERIGREAEEKDQAKLIAEEKEAAQPPTGTRVPPLTEKYPATEDILETEKPLPHEIVGLAKEMLSTKGIGVVMDLEVVGQVLTPANARVALRDIIKNKDKATKPFTEDVLELIRGKIYEARGIAEEVDFGEVKQRAKPPYVPFVPEPDIDPKSLTPALDAVKNMRMRGSKDRHTTGSAGEYDGAPTLGEFGARYQDIFGGQARPDEVATELARLGYLEDGDTSMMWELLKQEHAAAKKQLEYNRENADEGLEYNEWVKNRSYEVTGNMLKVGDTFKVFGEENKVIGENDNAVQIEREGGTSWLPFEEGVIRIDKGSLISPEKPIAKPPVSKAPPGELDLGVEKEDVNKIIARRTDEIAAPLIKAGMPKLQAEAQARDLAIKELAKQQDRHHTKEQEVKPKQKAMDFGTDDLDMFSKPTTPTQTLPTTGPIKVYRGNLDKLSYEPDEFTYLTGMPSEAEGYAGDKGKVHEYSITLQNPKILDTHDAYFVRDISYAKREIEKLKAQGYDGIIMPSEIGYFAKPGEKDTNNYIVFNKSQIKQASLTTPTQEGGEKPDPREVRLEKENKLDHEQARELLIRREEINKIVRSGKGVTKELRRENREISQKLGTIESTTVTAERNKLEVLATDKKLTELKQKAYDNVEYWQEQYTGIEGSKTTEGDDNLKDFADRVIKEHPKYNIGQVNLAVKRMAGKMKKALGDKVDISEKEDTIPGRVESAIDSAMRDKAMTDAYQSAFDEVGKEKQGTEKQIVIAAMDSFYKEYGLSDLKDSDVLDKIYELVRQIRKKGYEKFGLKGGYQGKITKTQVKHLLGTTGPSYVERVKIGLDKAEAEMVFKYSNKVNADLGYYENVVPSVIEMPEIVAWAKSLLGTTPRVKEKLGRSKFGSMPSGLFIVDKKTGHIELRADLFKVPGLAERVLSHEIGHAADWLPDKDLKRGNILGHIAALHDYRKTLLAEYPGAKEGVLTEKDRARLSYQALKLAKKGGEVEQDVTADQIKDVWNDVEKAKQNVGLYDYIRSLTREQKVSIIKAALKGKVADWVDFGKIYSTATRTNKQIYQELLSNEIKKRKLYEKEVIMDELKKLSQIWKPFNEVLMGPEYTNKYRYDPAELYADAISVLVNQPDLLMKEAPTFFKAFMVHMENRPEVMESYNRMLDLTADAEARFKDRFANIQDMFKAGDIALKNRFAPEKQKISNQEYLTDLKKTILDTGSGVYEYVWNAKTRNIKIDPEKNPIYLIEEMRYASSEGYAYTTALRKQVHEPMIEAGISKEEMGTYYLWRRATTERKDIANPAGHGGPHTLRDLDKWKNDMGAERFKQIEDLAEKDWKLYHEFVLKVLEKAEMYDPESMEYFKDNKNYATFLVQEYLQDKYKHHKEAIGRIYAQTGTLSRVANPFVARILKGMALVRAANIKTAKKATVDFFNTEFPGVIEPAKLNQEGRFDPPKDKDYKLIQYLDKGRMVGWYAPEDIADAFSPEMKKPLGKLIQRVMMATADPMKKVFVQYNVGWALMNIQRDIKAWAKQMPRGSLPKAFKYTWRARHHAINDVFKGESSELVQRAYRGKGIIYGRGYGEHLAGTLDDMEKLALNLTDNERLYQNRVWKPVAKFLDATRLKGVATLLGKGFGVLNKIGEVSERLTKLGALMYLDEKFPDMSEREKMHIVRKRGGSPDFLAGGTATQFTNSAFLFSNVGMQGISAARESWRETGRWRYWGRTFEYDILPKMVMLAATYGWMGAWYKRMMDKIPEYDKRNYICIPLYTQDNGKVVYIKMPHGFQGQVVGGLTWIMGRVAQKNLSDEPIGGKGFSAVTDYTLGQIPYSGFNPILGAVWDVANYFAGKNPYNSFYGEKAINELEFTAGGYDANKAMLKYTLSNLGFQSLIMKYGPRYEGKTSNLEKATHIPIVGTVLERFVKVSDQGDVEVLKAIAQEVDKTRSRETIETRNIVIDYLSKNKPTDDASLAKLYLNLHADGVMGFIQDDKGTPIEPRKSIGEFRQMVQEMEAFSWRNPWVNAWLRARNNETRLEMLYYLKNWRDPGQEQSNTSPFKKGATPVSSLNKLDSKELNRIKQLPTARIERVGTGNK